MAIKQHTLANTLPHAFTPTRLASHIALALSLSLSAVTPALATPQETDAEHPMERIEVRGIRASLNASINTKKFSNAVVDAVTAEDIGKFPDADVGESLGRIPGIAVNRQFGQGQQVSIRGASNQLTSTLFNGNTVASTGWFDQQATDRSFNYSLLPPEMVGNIEVYKSSQADISEGGVGGTVIINSRMPLELDKNTLFFSAKQDYGSISEQADPEFSGLYNWKNDQQTVGVLLAAADATTHYQRNGIESNIGYGEIVPTTFEQQRERSAFNAIVQYRPTDRLELGLNIMQLDMQANNANTSLFLI
ncbi:MAG: TonB-dependent receptor plug domain-containing protein, partial [Shewanella sp.]